MSLPKWIYIRDRRLLIEALSIAWEALEDIRKHQKTLMNDSGLKMSTTFVLSDRAMRRIEEVGK